MTRDGEKTIYCLYGIALASDFRFSHSVPPTDPPADLSFRMSPELDLTPSSENLRTVYESPFLDSEGNVRLRTASTLERDDLRFGNRIHFTLRPDEIACHFTPDVTVQDIEIHLLGAVCAYWLERRGLPCVHASAVVTPLGGVGFLAESRGGKSSLAAALMKAGLPLLTDDILAIEERSGRFHGRASYPQMRFWPREAEIFTGRKEGHNLVHPGAQKVRVPIGGPGFGTFHPHDAPLRALYLPHRRPSSEISSIRVEPIRPRDALIELVRESFVAHLVASAPWAHDRLARLAAIAEAVPMRRLSYPSGFDRLPEVRDAILDDLATLSRDPAAGGPG